MIPVLIARVKRRTDLEVAQQSAASPRLKEVPREVAESAVCRKAINALGSRDMHSRDLKNEDTNWAPGVELALSMARLHGIQPVTDEGPPKELPTTEQDLKMSRSLPYGTLAAVSALLGSRKYREIAETVLNQSSAEDQIPTCSSTSRYWSELIPATLSVLIHHEWAHQPSLVEMLEGRENMSAPAQGLEEASEAHMNDSGNKLRFESSSYKMDLESKQLHETASMTVAKVEIGRLLGPIELIEAISRSRELQARSNSLLGS